MNSKIFSDGANELLYQALKICSQRYIFDLFLNNKKFHIIYIFYALMKLYPDMVQEYFGNQKLVQNAEAFKEFKLGDDKNCFEQHICIAINIARQFGSDKVKVDHLFQTLFYSESFILFMQSVYGIKDIELKTYQFPCDVLLCKCRCPARFQPILAKYFEGKISVDSTYEQLLDIDLSLQDILKAINETYTERQKNMSKVAQYRYAQLVKKIDYEISTSSIKPCRFSDKPTQNDMQKLIELHAIMLYHFGC